MIRVVPPSLTDRVPGFVAASLVVTIALLVPANAQADIAPPRRSACYDHKVGDACSMRAGEAGVCTVGACTNKAGMPMDCVECVVAGEAPPPTRPDSSGFSPPLFAPSAVAAPAAPSSAPAPAPAGSVPAHGPAPLDGGCGRCATSAGGGRGTTGVATTIAVVALAFARRASRRREHAAGR